MKRVIGVLAVAMFGATNVLAQESKPAPRPGYAPSKAISARYATLRAAAIKPLRRGDQILDTHAATTVAGEIVDLEDGIVTIRVPVNEAQAQVLVGRGIEVVKFRAAGRVPVIHQGYFYEAYMAAPGVDLQHIDGRMGRTVHLTVARTQQGYLRVTGAVLAR